MNHTEQIRFFDQISETWDTNIPEINGNPIFEEWLNKLKLSDNMKVLDFGCGTGRLIPRIWEKIKPNGVIFAADFSEKMLSVAQKKYPEVTAKYICATPQTIESPDNYFDLIILLSVFPHFEDPFRDLFALAKKLKRKGELWIVHLQSRNAINEIHGTIGGAVKNHQIPDYTTMIKIIDSSGLSIINFLDKEDRYMIHCQKE